MKAEIITIGDELLIGQTVDTNSAWMGQALSSLGFDIHRKTSIHDKREDILGILSDASSRSDVILITGGLGPTSDDITKNTLCEFFNTKLVTDPRVLEMVESMTARRGFRMNENNRRQAEVPETCTVLTNAAGTAPGMWFEKNGTVFISMPGVPSEMKYIMNEHVIPALGKKFTSQVIIHKNIMTYGTPEAKLAEILTDFETGLPECIKLAYLPSSGIIKLRLTATGNNREELLKLTGEQVSKLYDTIPQFIYGEDEETLEMAVGRHLRKKNLTLCTAESCTGGNISRKITSVPGSSDYYRGSVIAYANDIKTGILGVDHLLIERDGAVSETVAAAMAEGARKIMKTDFSVATTGIAGPSGGTQMKPVGTLWIAVAHRSGTITEKHTFTTDRITNITRFTYAALNLLRKQIISA
ncbi:MAG TPA: competence/damage-inducible protein A [Bacteroidales bacterium]|jgi:nicotinamide-nucleotide amidase|nr:competence/damage-inducible protein A [Bacteroidales bacterium]